MGVICDLLVRIIITYTCMEPLSHSGGGGWTPVPAESYRKKGLPRAYVHIKGINYKSLLICA